MRALIASLLVVFTMSSALGYVLVGGRWPAGNIVMQLQLGDSGSLIDGAPSWGSVADDALAEWNRYLTQVELRVVRNSTASIGSRNRLNNVFWANDTYGMPFGDSIAVTLIWSADGTVSETDVIFDRSRSWNSYRGPLRRTATNENLLDFRRVALHEFGHVLGLDHPNDVGQNVLAIMNDPIDRERVETDDANGARAMYGSSAAPPSSPTPQPAPPPTPPTVPTGPVVINFPPRSDSRDFRDTLEVVYEHSLGRSPVLSYVDKEGSVIWTQEYLRYRVNRCGHQDAINRVMLQIDGRGVQPVCGTVISAAFPPRTESLDFRRQLESKYREGLRSSPIRTAVDQEGDVVWTQEYLRYRVMNRCSHQHATWRVIEQMTGLPSPGVTC